MARTIFGVVTSLLLLTATVSAGQDSIAAARDLYASAAYEDALAVLDRLPDAGRAIDEARAIEQYRAFCLLALGRTAEAEQAIESVVSAEPMYRPTADLSPRVRTAFSDVRRRVLPNIIQQKYMQAKASYDRKEFASAAAQFDQVLETMKDPDAAAALSRPPLSDMRMLALGFKDLATTAAAPPPPPPPPPAPEPPPVPKAPKIYTGNDLDVMMPVVIRQDLPAYPGQVPFPRQGMIEVLIDETGAVESALMRVGVSPTYDSIALNAAKNWRYRPATVNGVPVKYRKAVQVTIKPVGR
jgi:tetratricopeptide (TPR) repeat protein